MAPDKSKNYLIRIKGFKDKPIILGDLEFERLKGTNIARLRWKVRIRLFLIAK